MVNKYNNTYHRAIKMKPVDVKYNTSIDFDLESNDKASKFHVGDQIRVSKYKTFLLKDILQIGRKKFL